MDKWSRAWPPLRYFVSLLLTGISLLFAVSSYALDEKQVGPHGGTVLFVDAGVQDAQTLLSGVNPGVDVVRLRGDADGVQQIAEALKHYRNLDSIQIVSHGAPGRLALGSAMLDDADLNRYRSALQAWGHALKAHGSIQLYGCNVAQGTVGDRFVERVGQFTGAAVAASTDATGSPALGGNWRLEKHTAPILAVGAISAQAWSRYDHLLALPNGTQTIQSSWANGTSSTLSSFVTDFTFTNISGGAIAGDTVNNGIYDNSLSGTTTWRVNADGTNLGTFDLTAVTFYNVSGAYGGVNSYTFTFTGYKPGGGTVTATATLNYTPGGTTTAWTVAPDFSSFTGITGFQVSYTGGSNTGDGTFLSYAVANAAAPAPAPTFTSITPTSGPTTGGTSVTITGTNFTGATSVTFGGVAAASFTVNSSTQITATTPAGAAGITNVAITTPGGTATGTGVYTYTAVAPTVTGISPSSGPTAGNTAVTITGTSFTGATAVTIGGANCTGVTVVSATSITCTTPAGTAGAQNVAVTTAAGTGTGTGLYTYYAAPTVTGISPTGGPTTGGTSVIITGTNFTGATSVTIGGVAATSVTVNSATQITATTPAGTAGAADVVVTTLGGTGTGTGLYTYYAAPTVTSISPTSGSTGGGTSVTITGTNFTGATSVTFGGTAANGVTVVNSTTITATTPAGTAGAVSVAVTTPGGTGTGTGLYTYVASPSVTGISPTGGS